MGTSMVTICQLFEFDRYIKSLQSGGYCWYDKTETIFSKGIFQFISERELLHPIFEGIHLNTVIDSQGNERHSYLSLNGVRFKHEDYVCRLPCIAFETRYRLLNSKK